MTVNDHNKQQHDLRIQLEAFQRKRDLERKSATKPMKPALRVAQSTTLSNVNGISSAVQKQLNDRLSSLGPKTRRSPSDRALSNATTAHVPNTPAELVPASPSKIPLRVPSAPKTTLGSLSRVISPQIGQKRPLRKSIIGEPSRVENSCDDPPKKIARRDFSNSRLTRPTVASSAKSRRPTEEPADNVRRPFTSSKPVKPVPPKTTIRPRRSIAVERDSDEELERRVKAGTSTCREPSSEATAKHNRAPIASLRSAKPVVRKSLSRPRKSIALERDSDEELERLVQAETLACLAQKSRPKTSSVSLSTQTCEELLKQLVADNIHLYRAETEQVCVSQMPDSATNLSQEPSEYVRLVDSARTVSNIGGTSGRPESLYPTLEREPYNDLGIDNGLAKTPDNSESLYPTLEEQPYSVVVKAVDFALEKSKRDLHTTFQTDQLFYKEHIRTSPLRFLLTPTILRIINTSTGHCVKEDCIPIPCVSPLTWYDGFIAYKSGNAAVGRMIYSTLATTRCTEHTKGSYHITLRSNGELLYLKRSSIQMIEFWKSWIYFEWKLGHSSNAYDILAFALSILGSSHLEALEQFWQSCANTLAIEETFERQDQVTYPIASTPEAKPMAVDQDITPPLPSWTFEGYRSPQSQFAVTPSPPRSVFLEGKERNFADTPVFPETPLQDLIKRVGASSSATPTPTPRAFGSLLRSGRGPKLAGSTPFARRRADIYGDIMGKLQDMTLGSPMPPSQHQEEEKENAAQQESTIVKMEPGKVAKPPKVGVRFGPTDGSRVTILTPVRTKKREKELLGSEHVITPVRRSMRNFKEADYVTAPPSKNPLSDDPISTPTVAEPTTDRLLQNYGYAYKPNKHLDQTTTPMSRRRSTMKQERK